jgi:hypothetical protein
MAAFAPMPSASVKATAIHSAGARDKERNAIFKSRKNDIQTSVSPRSNSLALDYHADSFPVEH